MKILKKKKDKKKNDIKNGLKIIWKYILFYKKKVIKLTIFSVMIAFLTAGLPYLTGKIIDSLTNIQDIKIFNYEIKNYLFFAIIFSILALINIILSYRKRFLTGMFYNELLIDYKIKYFKRIILLPFSFHKEKKYGEWSSVLNRVMYEMPYIISEQVSSILPDVLFLVFAIFIALTINIYLAVIILIGVLIYIYVVISFFKKIKDNSEKENKVLKEADSKNFEALSNIFELKKNAAEKFEDKRVVGYFKKQYMDVRNAIEIIWANSQFFRDGSVMITKIVILFISLYFYLKNYISIGELVVISTYVSMVFAPIQKISDNWTWVIAAIVRINDAEKILETKPEIYEPKDFKELPKDFKGQIEFKNVDFAYTKKDKKVLKNINFKINSGETVAFVGESGVGKSTVIDLIGAFYFPQKGNVLIDGIKTNELKLTELREKIAFVSQDISLFNDTIKNNIKYGDQKATNKEILTASKKAFADDFIKEFPKGYKTLAGNNGVKLSGGQKQRISIARAFLRSPDILILDEPTSSLDIKSEKYITDSLKELMKNRTTIIIAHRLSTVRNADRIFIFKKGKIIESGSHKELLKIKNGEYKNMHDMNIGLS